MTRTASPGLKRGSATPLDLRHLARQLLGRNDAALEERLGQRDDPALVVAQLVVGLRGQRLDVPAPLIDADALAAHQHGEGVRAPFPFGIVVLGPLDLAGRQPAHVVMPSFDHATHSGHGCYISVTWMPPNSRSRRPASCFSITFRTSSAISTPRRDCWSSSVSW